MAGSGDEEEGYTDDDLDALGSDDFLELQEQALQATQQQGGPHQLQHLHLRGQPISQIEVDHVIQAAPAGERHVLPVPNLHARNDAPKVWTAQSRSTPGLNASGQPRPQSEAELREQWRLRRYGGPSARPLAAASSAIYDAGHLALPHRAPSQESPSATLVQGREDDLNRTEAGELPLDIPEENADLQMAMRELLLQKQQWAAERLALEQTVKKTNDQLLGKSGEISILRSNHAKQTQDRERMVEDLKRQQRAQEDRHRGELEQIRKEKEKLVTQNRFLDHENSERAWQTAKATKKGIRHAALKDIGSTPKRPKGTNFGDGFEDNELESISPSKAFSRQKASTPKAGAKRKRDILNLSPAYQADLPQSGQDSGSGARASPRLDIRPWNSDTHSPQLARSEFLHGLLFHKSKSDEVRVFEKMASFYYPDHPNASIAELFMDKLPPSRAVDDMENIPASFGLILVDLWGRCLTERYYPPIQSFMDLIRFILLKGNATTAIRLLDDIVNLAQRTADINIIPRFKKLNKNAKVISLHLHDQALESSEHVNTQQCLQLLYMTATLCSRDHNAMTRFWHCMRFDFISMSLRVVQPIGDIILTVRLLQTCVDHDIFAAIKPQSQEGGSAEQHVIDRLSSMLIEVPRPLNGDPYDTDEILKLRLTILGLIEKMCEQSLCSLALAVHPLALGRLVRLMSDELNAIYASSCCHASRSEAINRSIGILFYLSSVFPQEIDLQNKLRRQPGGVNKFLITLSRLAFSDAMWYERSISDEAFDCAHQLLEDFVTPEEAEAIKKAFVKETG